ncbi:MAG: hypothetical protein BWY09_01410 [Candidatus Hydrogenedentes bacterium ADurb.Bin179]|nr:MAG: hypothetical protein BWY09_01410 [Candidatus Hydrogenedentes bacterium ADurb.Bin179]
MHDDQRFKITGTQAAHFDNLRLDVDFGDFIAQRLQHFASARGTAARGGAHKKYRDRAVLYAVPFRCRFFVLLFQNVHGEFRFF